jgi:hypothetical protein
VLDSNGLYLFAVFVNTTFPDDYEGSPLRPEDLQKREAIKEQTAEEKKVRRLLYSGVSWKDTNNTGYHRGAQS